MRAHGIPAGDRAAARHADRPDEPGRGQLARSRAPRVGAEGAVRRRAAAHARVVLPREGPRAGGGDLRAHAHRARGPGVRGDGGRAGRALRGAPVRGESTVGGGPAVRTPAR